MARKTLSQAEARAWRSRALAAEKAIDQQRRVFSAEWPGGIEIGRTTPDPVLYASVKTARKLSHGVVVTLRDNDTLAFLALPLPAARP